MARYVVLVAKACANYSAHVPDVPGVMATGATVGEGIDTIREALAFHLEGLQRAGEPVPEPAVIASAVDVQLPTTTQASA